VHKLPTNLIFIHKLTIDLHYLVPFNLIQDQGMGKMIGLAKEDNGLYLLEDANRMSRTKNQIPLSLLLESTLSNIEKKSSFTTSFRSPII